MANIIIRIKRFLHNTYLDLCYEGKIPCNDEKYLKLFYKKLLNRDLNLENPKYFTEKLQWLKLNDRKDIYSQMVDKYEAKKYVGDIIGEQYVVPVYGVYNSWDDIDFDSLPNQFVIKCTHDSGGLAICKEKSTFDYAKAKEKICSSLKKNYYSYGREWPYKNIEPRIIVEKYLEDNSQAELMDYKFFCFNGEPRIMYISYGLVDHNTASLSFFDMDYNLSDCKRKDFKQFDVIPKKPKNFELMKEFARKLSKDIPHVRVDFFEVNGELYLGELTFFTCSGFIPFADDKWDLKMGEWLKLPPKE